MTKRNAVGWNRILLACNVKPIIAAQWSVIFADVVSENSFSAGDEEIDAFLGQILHESVGLTVLEENLSYSADRLMKVWPTRFASREVALRYERNPEALANFVYGGRMGNTQPGDGWRYRGRSPIQITGFDNYKMVGELIGQDLTVVPELLSQPRYALEATIAWWENRVPDEMVGDVERVTKRVNGGLIGLAHREEITARAYKALA